MGFLEKFYYNNLMLQEVIKNFNKQFEFNPIIKNKNKLKKKNKFILVGMGGSHLSGGLAKLYNPYLDIIIHRDYNLPALNLKELKERLIILSSYSGNTEEVISSFKLCINQRLNLICISSGGKLLFLAKKYKLPFIEIPEKNIQPRYAIGYSFKALLKIVGDKKNLKDLTDLKDKLKPLKFKNKGRKIATDIKNFIPIIYSSSKNYPLSYIWKIKFNETAKIPAFCNKFPELNHNEMQGFYKKELFSKFYFIFLEDKDDQDIIKKRMKITKRLFKKRGIPTKTIPLKEKDIFLKIFSNILLADWTSLFLSIYYKVDPEKVPIIESFKKLLKK